MDWRFKGAIAGFPTEFKRLKGWYGDGKGADMAVKRERVVEMQLRRNSKIVGCSGTEIHEVTAKARELLAFFSPFPKG